MKRKNWLLIVLLAAFVLCLTACEKKKESGKNGIIDLLTEPTWLTDEVDTPTTSGQPVESEPPTTTQMQVAFWQEEDLEYPMSFFFASGAGGWATELYLEADGSFYGSFHDSNMGDNAEEYPNGTVYICNFTGKFSPAERLDMYTYGMKLEELSLEYPVGEQWIEEGFLCIASEPYGIEGGTDFAIYLPNTPKEMLSEDALMWWPHRFDEGHAVLGGYGLYNLNGEYGFYCMTAE